MENKKMKTFLNRIYSDYFMGSRFDIYDNLLNTALNNSYIHLSLIEFYFMIKNDKIDSSKKYFIHRHDIDTDSLKAHVFFEIEKKLQIKSSYFFRLSTLDYDLMKEINEYGSEASYHFEELAQYGKDKNIKSKDLIIQNLDNIREIFKKNFLSIENNLDYKMKSVVSHGDFVNRKLGLTNSILINSDIRKQLKIEVEGYDDILLKNYSIKLADRPYPVFFSPISPFEAIRKNYKIIFLLTHPRHWDTNLVVNTKDNMQRIFEGLKYSF
jgi:hypothetical protein